MSVVSVIGAGYVGLTTGACLAELGHQVTLVDIDSEKVHSLSKGEIPIYEPELSEMILRQRAEGRICFTTNFRTAVPGSEFSFIAVNTPPLENGHTDTSFVTSAAESVLTHAFPGLVLIIKSTVPVGTGDEIARLASSSETPGVRVVANPEFLREGSAINDFFNADRIVVGSDDQDACSMVSKLYAGLSAPVVFCSRRSAELAKYAANAFLATRISFMNEISVICEAAQADIGEVTEAVGADHRIGSNYLQAGLGWGGSCFPKDVRSLVATANKFGCSSSILDAVIEVNSLQRQRAISMLLEATAEFQSPVVGVLGLAFKPNTDDIRESPALDIMDQLSSKGFKLRAHDPEAMPKARQAMSEVVYCDDPYQVAEGADVVFLATEWEDYLALDWMKMASLMRGYSVLDGRNVLDKGSLEKLGLTYMSFGGSHGGSVAPNQFRKNGSETSDEKLLPLGADGRNSSFSPGELMGPI